MKLKQIAVLSIAGAWALLTSSCSTSQPARAALAKFHEEQQASLIIQYASDAVSNAIKPPRLEGQFASLLPWAEVLTLARQQPGRDMAVVVLGNYPTDEEETRIKDHIKNDLRQAGYKRLVFLRGRNSSWHVSGLDVTADWVLTN